MVVVTDVVVVAGDRLIAEAVVEAGLTAYAVSAAFPFHRNAFPTDPLRTRVAVPPRSPSSRGAYNHLASPKCHVQALLLSSW
jgi:hypothetical protein